MDLGVYQEVVKKQFIKRLGVRLRAGAVQRLKQFKERSHASMLRLRVKNSGCSGYMYAFGLEDTARPHDIVVEQDGVNLVMDAMSLSFLEGCEVDYVEDMVRASFQVVANARAQSRCGCGRCFDVKC